MSNTPAAAEGDANTVTYIGQFAMPKPVRITGRSSSITNSFVNGVIPVVVPSEAEVREALEIPVSYTHLTLPTILLV